ncbi:hypothetical protein AAFF_G00192460 [Aldrovandia affinis]|uniref:Uncharacterized protein n=1 Tax=Aldrovandia affinis TaxID=143900 RepID=A0AAD7RJ80_9TELE|nr:hypothetical protein AAFF_G00192460 [Aldrovandia affinis]
MGENESPTAFVESQLCRWGMITKRDVHKDPILTMLFCTAILEGLPPPAKSRLVEMVGLTSKSHREFVEHVVHAMEMYHKEEKKQNDQVREVQRKLLQLQLEELKTKEKNKGLSNHNTLNLALQHQPGSRFKPRGL